MSFEEDYDSLLRIATAEIKKKKLINAEASDLVNECYIILIDGNEPYTLKAAIKIINSLSFKELNKPIHSNVFDIKYLKKNYTENSRPCKFCSENKPINYFRIRNHQTMRRDTMCDDCRNKEAREYFKRNRDKCIQRSVEYWKEHKEQLNAYKRSKYVSKRKTPKKEKVIKVSKIKEMKLPKKPNKKSLFYWI